MKIDAKERKKFESAVWAALLKENENLFKKGAGVLVAVSGGADSACLLHFLKYLSKKNRAKIFACHINHGLRENALRDEKFTKQYCKKLGVACHVVKVNVKELAKKHRLSTEHAARKARYEAFAAVAKKTKASYLAMAHHADDNAETVMLSLLRSPHIKGLAGIPPQRPLNESVTIVRPFLNITRQNIIDYAKFNDILFVEDETNFENDFTRNWIRNELLPLMAQKQPKIREHLLGISKEIRGACDYDND